MVSTPSEFTDEQIKRNEEIGNHWGDRYWGVCDGKGENNLGKIQMGIRRFWQDKDKDKPKQLF